MKRKYIGMLRLYGPDMCGSGVLLVGFFLGMHILLTLLQGKLTLGSAVFFAMLFTMFLGGFMRVDDIFSQMVLFGQSRKNALRLLLAVIGTEVAFLSGLAWVLIGLERLLAPTIWMWVRGLDQVVYLSAAVTDMLPNVLYVEAKGLTYMLNWFVVTLICTPLLLSFGTIMDMGPKERVLWITAWNLIFLGWANRFLWGVGIGLVLAVVLPIWAVRYLLRAPVL